MPRRAPTPATSAATRDFVAGHPEKLVDFAYRAIHEMTVSAKTVVAAHYDARPARAYFSSCSTGGRQALVEAQRYPEDFDGIVAGDASWDQMRLYAARVALNVFVNRDPAAVIPPSKYPMIHDAVLRACDAADGVKDGVIENPARCAFDFATLTCSGDDRADCLTKAAGRDREGDGVADRRPAERRRPASGPLLSRVGTGLGRCRRACAVRRISRRHEEDRVQRRLGLPHDPRPRRRRTRRASRQRVAVRRRSRSHALLQPRRQAAHVPRLGRSRWSRRTPA